MGIHMHTSLRKSDVLGDKYISLYLSFIIREIFSEMSALTNPTSNITANKHQKQIDWRRNKVRQFLIRGYSQYEIANTLHVS
jgi:DNA-binding NarL/FixJ family response regulator